MLPDELEGVPPDPRATTVDRQMIRRSYEITKNRNVEALHIYEPLPFQEQWHSCRTKEAIMVKGNQTGGPQRIDTPVLTPRGWVPIGSLRIGDQVIGGDGNPCNVVNVIPQGWLALFELTFDDGATTNCAENHHWRCKLKKSERFSSKYHKPEQWGVYSLLQIREHGGDDPVPRDRAIMPVCCVECPETHVPVAPYTLGVLLGDGCIRHGVASFTTEDADIGARVASELPEGMYIRIRESRYSGKAKAYHLSKGTNDKNPIATGLRSLRLMETRSETKFIPEQYLFNSRRVRIELLQGLMDTDGYCAKNGVPYFHTCSPSLANDFVDLVRSLGGKAKLTWKETFITQRIKHLGNPSVIKTTDSAAVLEKTKRRCLNMATVQFSLPSDIQIFGLERKQSRRKNYQHKLTSGRVLHAIRPIGNGDCVCITVDSPDHTYVTENHIVTHNSLSSFVEVARAVTNQDPYRKYPSNGIAVCLGYGEGHIGRVIHRYLFKPGAFHMIEDRVTRQIRTYRPWPPDVAVDGKYGDADREAEMLLAPPLIPKRFIDGKIAWRKRSENIFSVAHLTTGWEIHAFNSQGESEMAQGFQADLFMIDEDLATDGWYVEALGRTMKRKGKIRWNALPHNKTDDLVQMFQRAEEQASAGDPNPTTIAIRVTMYDNPYLPEESKRHNEIAWRQAGEDVYRARVLGEFTIDSQRMYPNFSKEIHRAIHRLTPAEQEHEDAGRRMRTLCQKVLTERGGIPPADWCRYMIFDPGHTIAAVLFACVPPPAKFGNFKIIYDELYITNCTASIWGNKVEPKLKDKAFQDFIIDAHGARLRELGSGVLPRRQYEIQLEQRKLECEARGPRFLSGSDDVEGRETILRTWLDIRSSNNPLENGYPLALVVVDNCPNLCREMINFRKLTARVGGRDIITDKGNRKNTHAVEALEYGAAHGLAYVKPPMKVVPQASFVDEVLKARKMRDLRRRMAGSIFQSHHINLGPQGSRSEE